MVSISQISRHVKRAALAISLICVYALIPTGRIHAETLKVGCVWYPPFYVIEKEGDKVTNITGINVDIVTKVLDRIGEKYTIELFPAKRLYANLVKGTTHLFYGLRTPEAVIPSSAIYHSRNTVSKVFLRAYSIGDTKPIADKYDLRGQRLIAFRGHGYGGFIDFIQDPENKITILMADTQENGFKMLKKKRGDYLLAPELPAMYAVKLLPEDYLPNLRWSPRLAHADGSFVISRKTPKAEDLRDRMDAAYEELLAEGAFEGLIVE